MRDRTFPGPGKPTPAGPRRDGEHEPIAPRPRPGATRCPYCHEVCEALDGACACASCLSRHHRACWEEAGACGNCRGDRRLEPAAAGRVADPHGYVGVVDGWVRLGLAYNGALAALTLLCLNVALLRPSIAAQAALGAFVANSCFLLGPATELVARRLGYRGQTLRWALFVSGLGLALLLALISCLTMR